MENDAAAESEGGKTAARNPDRMATVNRAVIVTFMNHLVADMSVYRISGSSNLSGKVRRPSQFVVGEGHHANILLREIIAKASQGRKLRRAVHFAIEIEIGNYFHVR
jgi:hypothetical protein